MWSNELDGDCDCEAGKVALLSLKMSSQAERGKRSFAQMSPDSDGNGQPCDSHNCSFWFLSNNGTINVKNQRGSEGARERGREGGREGGRKAKRQKSVTRSV